MQTKKIWSVYTEIEEIPGPTCFWDKKRSAVKWAKQWLRERAIPLYGLWSGRDVVLSPEKTDDGCNFQNGRFRVEIREVNLLSEKKKVK